MANELSELLADLPQIKEDIAFVRAIRRLLIVTTAGTKTILFSDKGDNAVIDLRDVTPTGQTVPTQLPDTTGHAGSVLTTDGSTTSWL
jgi:hypothetical protein